MELRDERRGRRRSEVTDPERREELREGARRGLLDLGDEVRRARLADPLEFDELLDGQRVQVGRVVHQTGRRELLDHLFAEALDVHRPARGEVGDLLVALGRAVGRHTAGVGLPLGPHERRAAHRAVGGEHPGLGSLGAVDDHRSDDLGDHVAGLAHDDRVAGADVLHLHLVLVVQGRHAHGRPPDEHRIEDGERSGAAGAPDRHLDREQGGRAFLRRELVGDRPARRPRREPEHLALRPVVDLDDHAVDLEVELVSTLLPVEAVLGDRVDRLERDDVGVDREPERGDVVELGPVRRQLRTAVVGVVEPELSELVAPERQLALGGLGRVLLTQAAGRRVAGVDERLLAGGRRPLVEPLERGRGHVDLAAHLDHRRSGDVVGSDAVRDVVDRGDVRRDVLPHPAVAAGRGAHEAAVLVAQAHRQAVELQLADERRRLAVEALDHPLGPGAQFVRVHGVVEAHHRHVVLDGLERRTDRSSDLLGRRVGRDEVGMLGLERPQLTHECVVVRVADLGIVERVVPLVVVADQRAQLVDASGVVAVGAGLDLACGRRIALVDVG